MSGFVFTLVPRSYGASTIVAYQQNHLYCNAMQGGPDGAPQTGLGIGIFTNGKCDRDTLAVIGRGEEADIFVDDPRISRTHCSFDIEMLHGQIIFWLCDRSFDQTMSIAGNGLKSFPSCGPRAIQLKPGRSILFELDAGARDPMAFEIIWHLPIQIDWPTELHRRNNSLRRARTITTRPTMSSSMHEEQPGNRPNTRIAPGQTNEGLIQTTPLDIEARLGKGGQGEVFRVTVLRGDKQQRVPVGKEIAVKIVRKPNIGSSNFKCIAREVRWLQDNKNDHLTKMYTHQLYPSDRQIPYEHFRIYMPLRAGSVSQLFSLPEFKGRGGSVRHLAIQMADALSYLEAEFKGIHRDIKPDNILYSERPTGKHYELADFGLSASLSSAKTQQIGTRRYMAPEIDSRLRKPYGNAADIWSLFVTLAWCMNAANLQDNFDAKHNMNKVEVFAAIQAAASHPSMQPYCEMAKLEPKDRPTAKVLLEELSRQNTQGTLRRPLRQDSDAANSTVVPAKRQKGRNPGMPQWQQQTPRYVPVKAPPVPRSIQYGDRQQAPMSGMTDYRDALSPPPFTPLPPPPPIRLSKTNQRSKFSFGRSNTRQLGTMQERDQDRDPGRSKFNPFGRQ